MEKLCDYEDFIVYRTNCGCGCRDHAIDLCFEIEENGLICMNFEAEFSYTQYHNLLKRIFHRILDSMKILFSGNLKVTSEFYFRDENHVREMIEGIENSLEKLKN